MKTEDETNQALARLLDVGWENIAAAGWNRHQLHGRGALLAASSMLDGEAAGMDYITHSTSAPLPDWLLDVVEKYDPETSVVLVFVEPEVFKAASRPIGRDMLEQRESVLSGPACFRVVSRQPPPPVCAKNLAH